MTAKTAVPEFSTEARKRRPKWCAASNVCVTDDDTGGIPSEVSSTVSVIVKSFASAGRLPVPAIVLPSAHVAVISEPATVLPFTVQNHSAVAVKVAGPRHVSFHLYGRSADTGVGATATATIAMTADTANRVRNPRMAFPAAALSELGIKPFLAFATVP